MTPTEIRADYAEAMNAVGEIVLLRRYTGTGAVRPRFDVQVRARVIGYGPDELVGTIQQGDRRIILLAEDLITAQFGLPILMTDKIVVRGRELSIVSANDSTRRVAGVLVAYEIQARG